MKILVLIIGIIIALAGIVGVADPSVPLEIGRSLLTTAALYVVAVARVGVGLLLLAVASGSRAPAVLRVLGVVIVIAGIVTPLFGVERSQAVLNWWAGQGATMMRLTMCLPVVLGLFIAYAVAPRRASS